jgi:hypothetical protein
MSANNPVAGPFAPGRYGHPVLSRHLYVQVHRKALLRVGLPAGADAVRESEQQR